MVVEVMVNCEDGFVKLSCNGSGFEYYKSIPKHHLSNPSCNRLLEMSCERYFHARRSFG